MLPGFRFLFAATLLTVSLVVFGLGAAALLRASHERFASLPTLPIPSPVFARTADATPPPTLALLRVEPATVETSGSITPPADTLLPTDKQAALSNAPRVEDVATPQAVEAKPEPTPEPLATVAEPAVADAPPLPAPVETVAAAIVEPLQTEPPPVSDLEFTLRQVAALPEPEITGSSTPAPVIAEQPFVNAKPIKRPPTPVERPTTADVVAALPDPAVAAPVAETIKPVVRKRKPLKRVARPKRRVVARSAPQRAAPQQPASPFRASPFGT